LSTSSSYKHLADEELQELYRSSGNNLYLGILLERYTLLLFGVCMKYLKNEEEARDAVQHVFAKAIHELPKYKVAYFKSWIYMVARNHCLMQLRHRHKTVPAEVLDQAPAPGELSPLDSKLENLQREKLASLTEQGLQQLQEAQKQCLTLFYLEHKSYKQICDITGHSLMQVKSLIQNGKRNVRIWVEKQLKQHAS